MATVRLPAEAESYRVETIAQGRRTQVRLCFFLHHRFNLSVIFLGVYNPDVTQLNLSPAFIFAIVAYTFAKL